MTSNSHLSKVLGYQFQQTDLFLQAITHKSFSNDSKDLSSLHNEKLEFLGDAVLELSITHLLFNQYSEDSEGDLSKKRASLVNEEVLAALAVELDLPTLIRLGKGETQTGGSAKPRLLASALEALIGAVYLDSGFDEAKNFVAQMYSERIATLADQLSYKKDYKTRLQEVIQKKLKTIPLYRLIKTEGPEHQKSFFVQLVIDGEEVSQGQGKNKKEAEQEAAKKALVDLKEDV